MPRSHDTSTRRRGRSLPRGGRGRSAWGAHCGQASLSNHHERVALAASRGACDSSPVNAERILGNVGFCAYSRVDNYMVLCDDVGPATP